MTICPVCSELLRQEPDHGMFWPCVSYDCPRCGRFVFRSDLSNGIGDYYSTPHRRSVLSHRLRCSYQPERRYVFLGWNDLPAWRLDDPLPTPAEQADRFVLWIGDHQPSTAESVEISAPEVSAWIGAAITSANSKDEVAWVNDPENGLN